MTMRVLGVVTICVSLCLAGAAQQSTQAAASQAPVAPNAAPPSGSESFDLMPPSAAYAYATQPVDVVRRSADNMSDAERYAWIVAIARAAKSCEAAKPSDYTGEELYSLAQLCALGKAYPEAIASIKAYLAGAEAPKNPELARALWARTALQMADGRQAQRVTEQLIDMYPYDAVVHNVSQDVLMSLAGPDEGSAIALAIRRQPALLNAIGSGHPLRSPSGDFEIPTSWLFRDALKLAAIYKHRGDDASADSVFQQIAARLQPVAAQVSAAQHRQIDLAVKHFLMLGKPAAPIGYWRRVPKTQKRVSATLDGKGKVIVLLFYTSWCAQCFKAMADLPKLPAQYKNKVAPFGVTTPDTFGVNRMDAAAIDKALLAEFKAQTAGISLLVADDDVRRALSIEDFPMLVVIGPTGNVQFLDELPHDRFAPRGYIDRMLRRLTNTPAPKSTVAD